MRRFRNIKIADLNCRFEQSYEEFSSIWQWKLDSYCIHDCQEADIVICENGHQKIDKGHLITEANNGFYVNRVYSCCDSGTIWTFTRKVTNADDLVYSVNSTWDRVALLADKTCTHGQLAFEYLSLIMPGVFLKRRRITFHGVLLEDKGRGIIISAPSGTGKTTHARMWRDLRHSLILNGDRAVCRNTKKGWIAYGTPWSGTSGEQINRSVPVKALVVLERSEENRTEVLTGLTAFGAVMPNLLYPVWDAELTGMVLELIDIFLADIPVLRLYCRPDVEAVAVLTEALEKL